jgi:hypothetical protein
VKLSAQLFKFYYFAFDYWRNFSDNSLSLYIQPPMRSLSCPPQRSVDLLLGKEQARSMLDMIAFESGIPELKFAIKQSVREALKKS